ncbi:MAG TPA: hypothetical protein VGI19_16620 [Candidatus Cybelea sp.]
MFHRATLLARGGGVSRRRAAQDLGSGAAALDAQSLEKIAWPDLAVSGALLGQCNDAPHTGGNQNALPQTILAGAERSPNLRVHLGDVDPVGIKSLQGGGVTLLQQGDKQMFGADIIVTVVPALLLGYPKHAPCGGVKV